MNTIKTALILIALALIASSCKGQNNNMNMNTNADGYVAKPIDGGIEYRKDDILYTFKDGALTSIEQLDWGGTDELPESWAYLYSDTPKEIIYTEISGDKSQSKTYLKMNLEKTVFNEKYYSNDGWHTKEYEAPTPLELWINLSQIFNWDTFSKLKNGPSEQGWDGFDITITVTTESGTFSVTNGGNAWHELWKIISDYRYAVLKKAEETIISHKNNE